MLEDLNQINDFFLRQQQWLLQNNPTNIFVVVWCRERTLVSVIVRRVRRQKWQRIHRLRFAALRRCIRCSSFDLGNHFGNWDLPVCGVNKDADYDSGAVVDVLVNDVQFHRLLLAVDPVLAWMVEVKLNQMIFAASQFDELPLVSTEDNLHAMFVLLNVPYRRLLQMDFQSCLAKVCDYRVVQIDRRLLLHRHASFLQIYSVSGVLLVLHCLRSRGDSRRNTDKWTADAPEWRKPFHILASGPFPRKSG